MAGVYYSNVSVAFKPGLFTQVPVITFGGSAGPGYVSTAGFASPPTVTGFTARVINFGAAIPATAVLHWHATQR